MKKQKTLVRCPNCGNQDVKLITRKHQYRISLVLLGLCLIGISVLSYFCNPLGEVHNEVAHALGFMTGFVGVIVLAISRHAHSRYKCNHCGQEFTKH